MALESYSKIFPLSGYRPSRSNCFQKGPDFQVHWKLKRLKHVQNVGLQSQTTRFDWLRVVTPNLFAI